MNNMKLDQKKFHEVLTQSEQEYDTFFKGAQTALEDQLKDELQRTEDLRGSISRFTKENDRLFNRKFFLSQLEKETENQLNDLKEELFVFQDKQTALIRQLSEKEEVINLREQQIKDFRMKNQHLQNF